MLERIEETIHQVVQMYFFVVAAVISFVMLVFKGAGGHWLIFSGAAQVIWQKQNPHGLTFGSDAGFWFYSPNCGLLLYGPFAWLPQAWGQALFMGMSLVVLLSGAWMFWKSYQSDLSTHSPRFHNFVWIAASSEVIGTFLNARIEILILGILFWCLTLWRRQKFSAECLALILLALVSEWKSQTLLVAFFWVLRSSWKHRLVFVLAYGAWYLWPTLYIGWDQFFSFEASRRAGIQDWMLSPFRDYENWLSYQQIYTFLFRTFGWHFKLTQVTLISIPIVSILTLIFLKRKTSPTMSPLLATIFGLYFANVFLPLSQSSGFALYIPCLFWLLYFEPKARWWILAILWFGVSGLYSDLVPKPWRLWAFEYAIKAASLGLAPLLIWRLHVTKTKHVENYLNSAG